MAQAAASLSLEELASEAPARLSPRQLEALKAVSTLNYHLSLQKQVAAQLSISPISAKNYLNNVRSFFRSEDMFATVCRALNLGILSLVEQSEGCDLKAILDALENSDKAILNAAYERALETGNLSYKKFARQLNVNPTTLKIRIGDIHRKLSSVADVHNHAQLAVVAYACSEFGRDSLAAELAKNAFVKENNRSPRQPRLNEKERAALKAAATLGYSLPIYARVEKEMGVSPSMAQTYMRLSRLSLGARDSFTAVCRGISSGVLLLDDLVNGFDMEKMLATLTPESRKLLAGLCSFSLHNRALSLQAVSLLLEISPSSIRHQMSVIYGQLGGVRNVAQLAVVAYYVHSQSAASPQSQGVPKPF